MIAKFLSINLVKKKVSLFLGLVILSFQSLFGNFDHQFGVTLTLSLTFDVIGQARVTPFLLFPDGTSNIYDSEILTDESFDFPPFVYEDPSLGVYGIGASVIAITNATVSLDTTKSCILRENPPLPDAELHFRPTITNLYSTTLLAGEISAINVPMSYSGL